MSLHPNRAALTTIDIPWKPFVKESTETPSESGRTFSTCLNFNGIEAQKAYEEVIRQNFASEIPAKSSAGSSNSLCKFSNLHSAPKDIRLVKNVTTNSILKAVEQNDLHFLKKYLNSENVDISDDFGWTPLMSAAYNGNLEVIEYLLQLGVNRRVKEKSGLTAAQLALKRNHLNVVALLKRKSLHKSNDGVNVEDGDTLYWNKTDEEERTRVSEMKPMFGNNPGSVTNNSKNKNAEFFCKICKTGFKETSVKQHESSTLHIFNSKPKLCLVGYGIAKQNKGYQMLLNTGWDEETGLGPMGEGTKYPVKTILKRDRKGFDRADEKEARVTHFKPGDISAVAPPARVVRQKTLKKKDREKLLTREAMKDRMIRIALS